MQTTTVCEKVCELCGGIYEVTERSDDGYDWCGHRRGGHYTETITDECPYCNKDIVKAGEIVKKKREEDKAKEEIYLNQLSKYKFFKFKYPNSRKSYMYKSEKELSKGIYKFKKQNKEQVVLLESEFECNISKLQMTEVQELLNLKVFTGIHHTNDDLLNVCKNNVKKAIEDEVFEDAFLESKKCVFIKQDNLVGFLNCF